MTVADRNSVIVCICTCRRPGQLDALLHRLADMGGESADTAAMGIVIIDDDPAGSAEAVAAHHADGYELGLQYRCTASGNISTARNAAIDAGTQVGEWLALIDDDCMPESGWIRELLATMRQTNADLVSGRCYDEAPDEAPQWLSDEPFLDGFDPGVDAGAIEIGALKNTLVSAEFLRRNDIRFDPEFGTVGGEDVMFFHACHRAGCMHVFSSAAVVSEPVPLERCSLTYQLRRSLWYGNTGAITSIASGRHGRFRHFAGGIKTMLGAAGPPLRAMAARRHIPWRYALATSLQGAGRAMGAMGAKLRHH